MNEATSSAAGVTILAAERLQDDEAEVDAASSAMLSSVPGSRLRVVSGREELTPAGPMPASRVVRVVGHRPSAPRQKGILRISAGAFDALAGPGVATEIEILPAPGADETRLAKAIETALGGEFRVERPEESQRALSAALRLERLVLFAALGLVIVVAASGVAAELSFLAVERRSGAAILRAQGATPAMIRRLYLWVGLLTGVAGGAAGALLGAAVGVILDRTGAIPLPAGLYTIDRLPFDVKGGTSGRPSF